ncbi:MAG: glycosyltransferase family 2 protein, partial [Micromonosporaceae bacterium]
MTLTVTAVVPAYNEADGIGATLESLLRQSEPFTEIVVVDDCSTDRTSEVARSYGVTVLRSPTNLGSKARAQNYALPHVETDLVLPVDADTVLGDDYVAKIKGAFDDERVAVAAGCVLTRRSRTTAERGRMVEYLFGFHWHRPIQNHANSPMVCSGCCSAFRTREVVAFGGFPERTIVEDMDYTWSKQIEGRRAVYVAGAVAYAADPEDFTYLRKQVWRWMAGFFQNVRLHMPDLVRRKKVLALWVALAVWEILTVPIWYATPFVASFGWDISFATALLWFFGAELLLLVPPLVYGAYRRKVPISHIVACIPALYVVKAINFSYAWKALVLELILVPLGLRRGLHEYHKGRPDPVPADPGAA